MEEDDDSLEIIPQCQHCSSYETIEKARVFTVSGEICTVHCTECQAVSVATIVYSKGSKYAQ